VSRVRPPAAAGTFYPSDPAELEATIDALLEEASRGPGEPASLVALIVPHAGHRYSGPVAASAYVLLRGSDVRRAAILGPAHFVPLEGCAVPAADAWRTPLGDVEVDAELRDALVGSGATVDDEPHEPEHAVEVQLPFLQRLLGPSVRVLPVTVGITTPEEVAATINAVPTDALVIVSTDLSHYLNAATARRLDRRTAEAILACELERIGPEDGCGAYPLRGLLELARRRDLAVELLDLRNSADTAGHPGRVVGYGAFALRSRGSPSSSMNERALATTATLPFRS
jgi:AmmeMemoRadiSam system protein B